MRRLDLITAVAAVIVVGCGQGAAQPATAPASGSASAPTATTSPSAPRPTPSAEAASTLPPGGTTFKSRVYGYSVLVPPGWGVHAATVPADDPKSTDANGSDEFTVPGTDTTVVVEASDLPAGGYDVWVVDYHHDQVANVPQGCDGGDPSTWPTESVGTAQGHVQHKCNEIVVAVPVGRRVYSFIWNNGTFEGSRHLAENLFTAFVQRAVLPDASTASKPLWSAPPVPSASQKP